MHTAYIALGSNLQQPQQQILSAFSELAELPHTRVANKSSLYRTVPLDRNYQRFEDQPEFINAAAKVVTELPPLDLLHALLAIEARHGRERPYQDAPRVLDLDLLLYDDVIMNTAELTLPHPRMHERGFVLLPLAEIAPELVIANYGNIAQLGQKCLDQGVARIDK